MMALTPLTKSADGLCASLGQLGAATTKCDAVIECATRMLSRLMAVGNLGSFLNGLIDHLTLMAKLLVEVRATAANMADAIRSSISQPLTQLLTPSMVVSNGSDARKSSISGMVGSGAKSVRARAGRMLSRRKKDRGWGAEKLEPVNDGEDADCGSIEDPEELKMGVIEELNKVMCTFCELAEAVRDEGAGTHSELAAQHLNALFALGSQLAQVVESSLDDLKLEVPVTIEEDGGKLAEAFAGVKETVDELRGQAMQELQGVMDSAGGVLDQLAEGGSDEAMSLVCDALEHPICGLIKDGVKMMTAKKTSESWRVREVAGLCMMRVIDAIDRSVGQPPEGNEDDFLSDAMREEHHKKSAAHAEKLEQLRSDVARLRAQSAASRTVPNATLTTKEDELRSHDVGGAQYVSPKLLSRSERQSELAELKAALMRELLKRRCMETSKSARAVLRFGEELAASQNRLALSSEAAAPFEQLSPNEILAKEFADIKKAFGDMQERMHASTGIEPFSRIMSHSRSISLPHPSSSAPTTLRLTRLPIVPTYRMRLQARRGEAHWLGQPLPLRWRTLASSLTAIIGPSLASVVPAHLSATDG